MYRFCSANENMNMDVREKQIFTFKKMLEALKFIKHYCNLKTMADKMLKRFQQKRRFHL